MPLSYCKRCIYPDTKPGIRFDDEGICSGCRAQEQKREVNWAARLVELRSIAEEHKRRDGSYDCLIPVSGGKDSHAQVYYIKEVLGLNPICATVAPQVSTEIGRQNLKNLQSRYKVDLITLEANPGIEQKMTAHGMIRNAWPNWAHDKLIYSWPLRLAQGMGIKFVIMGENHDYESGGKDLGAGAEAAAQMLHSLDGEIEPEEWKAAGVSRSDLNPYFSLPQNQVGAEEIRLVWLGHYICWDSFEIYRLAREHGFREMGETPRGLIDSYHGIDDEVVQVNGWLKFIKFGFARVTDVAFNHISFNRMTRDEAVRLANEREGELDPRFKNAFMKYTGFDESTFDALVSRFANHDIVHFSDGRWRLKNPVR